MKKCTQCGIEKNETEYYKDKRLKSGLQSHCKICQNNFRNEWRKNNPENVKKNLRGYYSRNKEKWVKRENSMSPEKREEKRICSKDYYKKHKDEISIRRREKYRFLPVEEKKKYSQKYYEEHKDEICKRSRENYANMSPEQKAENVRRTKEWRHRNLHKMRAWSAVGNAIIGGEMVKPDCCQQCSKIDCRIHGHHEDYEKPLEVQWLCHECHMKLHRINKRII